MGRQFGGQAYIALESRFYGVAITASSLRSFGEYNDLASNIAQLTGPADMAGARPTRALDRISIGTTSPFNRNASIGASFLHAVDGDGNRSDIVSASWSRTLRNGGSIFATAFADFAGPTRNGVFVGYARRLGGSVSASASVSAGNGGAATINLDAVKPLGHNVGSFGWRVLDSEGANSYREAALAYRARAARIQGSVGQSQSGLRGTFDVEGSVATLGGGIFFANRIDDAFAVVRVGLPNVPVFYDNRPIGLTDPQGMILVPSLRSYERNQITIDPSGLPVDADITTARTIVAPADRAGVLVDFGGRISTNSALVAFKRADGSFVPVGSAGRSDTGEEFIVGYDGQSFLRNLAPRNSVVIDTAQGPCRAQFAFAARAGEQVFIPPVICSPVASEVAGDLRGPRQ
jgi:outer membrane usher protein